MRSIGRGAFDGCTSLSSVTLPFIGSQRGDSNSKNTFSYIFDGNVPSSLKTVSITNEIVVPESAFAGCGYIENIYLNDGVNTIGAGAFRGCASLVSFAVPSSVTEIMDSTFRDCSSLTRIDGMTDNITAIGERAFEGCSSLASVYVPKVTVINDRTFYGCSSLTQIEIPTTVTNIGEEVLAGCTKLRDVKVPFVGANMDPGSTAVTDQGIFGYFFGTTDNSRIPASVTTVEVTGTDRNAYIPKQAFENCGNIEDIMIDGGRSVLDSAFRNCYALKNLYIPKSISTIGKKIMENCTRLETLTVPFIGSNRNDKDTETSVLGGFFDWDNDDITETLQYYDEEGSYHYYKVPRTLKNVSILNQTTIPTGALMECDFIENVSIVTGASMGARAFYHCASLKTVTLPNDLQTIGDEAFAECESLETINIPTRVKTIGSQVFYDARNLKNVTIPDSVIDIADDVFNGTGLYELGEVNLMAANGGVITCSADSYAYEYAVEHGIETNVVPAEALSVKSVGASASRLATGGQLIDVTDTNGLDGNVYVAAYDENGCLCAVQMQQKERADQVEYRFTFAENEISNADHVKVFVWDEDMTSLTSGVTELQI